MTWNPRIADVQRFTEGDCHIFAWAIHQLTGWPICTFDSEEPGGDIHAFNLMPDGRFIDVEGVHTPEEFMGIWAQYGAADTCSEREWRALRAAWGGPQYGPYSYRRAKILAARLINEAV